MKKSLAVVILTVVALLIVQSVLADPGDLPYKIYIPIVEVPPCADPLVGGELYATASASIVHVGEIVTVTGSLYNNGCGVLGLPEANTNVYDTSVLSPTELHRVIFYGTVTPGNYWIMQFTFLATGPGLVDAMIGTNYEPAPARIGHAVSNPIPIRVIP